MRIARSCTATSDIQCTRMSRAWVLGNKASLLKRVHKCAPHFNCLRDIHMLLECGENNCHWSGCCGYRSCLCVNAQAWCTFSTVSRKSAKAFAYLVNLKIGCWRKYEVQFLGSQRAAPHAPVASTSPNGAKADLWRTQYVVPAARSAATTRSRRLAARRKRTVDALTAHPSCTAWGPLHARTSPTREARCRPASIATLASH